MLSDQVCQTFLAVRASVSRGACERALKRQGLDASSASYEQAKEKWRSELHLNSLHREMLEVLAECRGQPVFESTPFPAMIWYGGARDAYDGHRFTGTFRNFIDHVLVARAQEIAPKKTGWIVTPTSNLSGHRTNAATTAMHALNLDCDGRGEPDALIQVLRQLGFAFALYQSGGWSSSEPKWHLLLPLAAPFDTTTPEKIEQWKVLYNHARVVLGTIGHLAGEGFDPTCETPCMPVFVTERRSESDPPRRVIWQTGASLDLVGLAALLPTPEEGGEEQDFVVQARDLDSSQIDQVIAALVAPMSKILSGRRDLYLCLPGTLLDRGVAPEAVLQIIEEISRRCPGDPRYSAKEVADKHREHVHCAKTTITKYEAGGAYTRIGTLATHWSEVAQAIDLVLPDARLLAMREFVERKAAATMQPEQRRVEAPVLAVAPVAVPISLDDIRKKLVDLRRRKKSSSTPDNKVRGYMIDMMLNGKNFVPFFENDDRTRSPAYDRDGKPIDLNKAINIVTALIANSVPIDTPFDAVVEIMRGSLYLASQETETPYETVLNRAEYAYTRAITQRVEKIKEREREEKEKRLLRMGAR